MQAAAFVNRKMKKFFVHRDENAQKTMGSMLTAHYSLDGVWAKASSSDGSVRILMNLPLSEDTLRSTINDLGIYTLMKAEFQR